MREVKYGTTQDTIEKLNDLITRDKEFDKQKYHNAKLLLKIYRDVVWRVEDALCELDNQAYHFGGRRISELIDYLSFDFDEGVDKNKIEAKLTNISETKCIIDIIDKALIRLKNYPNNGELYYEIISKQYILKYRYTESEILDTINIERTMFYRRKKEAINLIGVILWGYILPQLKEYWSNADLSLDFA